MRWGVEDRRRLETVAVDRRRVERATHVEMVGKGERQAEHAGEAGAVVARAEEHDFR
jgi:hypothetical protein